MAIYSFITSIVAAIIYLVAMGLAKTNEKRREIFPWIVTIPMAFMVLPVAAVFFGIAFICELLTETIPNFLFKDKR